VLAAEHRCRAGASLRLLQFFFCFCFDYVSRLAMPLFQAILSVRREK
jgi:hypothetical protein